MKFFAYLLWGCIFFQLLLIPSECKSQRASETDQSVKKYNKLKPYLNIGYLSNLPGPDDNRNAGGSLRMGILTKGKFGFHLGYAWYKVDFYTDPDAPPPDYEDKGSAWLLGVDFRLMDKAFFQWYLQAGLANEKFESVYYNSSRIDIENSIIPQLGFMFHMKSINAYIGMGAANFNIGVGYTF